MGANEMDLASLMLFGMLGGLLLFAVALAYLSHEEAVDVRDDA